MPSTSSTPPRSIGDQMMTLFDWQKLAGATALIKWHCDRIFALKCNGKSINMSHILLVHARLFITLSTRECCIIFIIGWIKWCVPHLSVIFAHSCKSHFLSLLLPSFVFSKREQSCFNAPSSLWVKKWGLCRVPFRVSRKCHEAFLLLVFERLWYPVCPLCDRASENWNVRLTLDNAEGYERHLWNYEP